MNTDLERELRELFREKAGEAPVATPDVESAAPQRVLRRGRVRQVGTVLGSLVVVSAVVVGSVAGMSSLLRGRDTVGGPGGYEVFERTATIEAFTVTSPSDWYLVNHWPESIRTDYATSALCPEGNPDINFDCAAPNDPTELDPSFGLPMFQLTSWDLGLSAITCGSQLGGATAVLYVALDHDRDVANQYPPYLGDPSDRAPMSEGDGPCGHGLYASFSVGGQPFFAWVGVGPSVSAEDRSIVMGAFESLAVDDAWAPIVPLETTPAYVIAGGGRIGDEWRLELRPGESTPVLSLEGLGETWRVSGDRVTVPAAPIEICCAVTDGTGPASFVEATFGFVTKDATAVELRVVDDDGETGDVLQGTILPLPPSLDVIEADVFFIAGTAGLAGSVVPVVPGGDSTPTPGEVRTPVVELSGSYEEQVWTARFEGSFADGTACVRVAIALEPQPEFCPHPPEEPFPGDHPTMHDWLTSDVYLHAGSVPLDVVELRFVGDDDAIVPQAFRCAMGPLGWTEPDVKVCVLVLPPAGSGTLEFLDAEGNAISAAGLAWGSDTLTGQSPEPVHPVLGGTYWGVYAWFGSTGNEAEIEAAQRYLEERGVHGLRGSLFCDEGAAEALGTSAEHKVAVYFETEEEANTFALEAGLLGHEAGPVVAKVTITCLE